MAELKKNPSSSAPRPAYPVRGQTLRGTSIARAREGSRKKATECPRHAHDNSLSLSVHGAKLRPRNSCFQALAGFCDYVMASVADHEFFGRHKMTKRFLAGVVLCGALLAASSLQAHHSLAGVYDLNKVERATGVVQKFAFTNPHGALHIEIKNAEGEAKVWQLTTGSANVLTTPGSPPPARIGSSQEIPSPSPSIRRSTAPPSVFSDRSSCRTRKKSSLSPTDSA